MKKLTKLTKISKISKSLKVKKIMHSRTARGQTRNSILPKMVKTSLSKRIKILATGVTDKYTNILGGSLKRKVDTGGRMRGKN